MTHFDKLRNQKAEFLEDFHTKLRAAEEARPMETYSVNLIQRLYRGVVARERIAKKWLKANEIQRVLRGHFGRMVAREKLLASEESRQLSLFNYLCIQIQKCFRAYYSRKYKHDQARRKEYVRMVIEKGELVRETLRQYAMDVQEREELTKNDEKQEEFKNLASDLHHLVSTKRIPGVYRPLPFCNDEPTMNDLPIEDHIRGVVKDLLRTRGIAHRGLETDLNGTKKIPLKGLKYRLSIQASAPYDAVEAEEKRQKHLTKVIAKHSGKSGFVAGGKTNIINKDATPLSVGNPYMDPWANPMLVKGVPRDQAELNASARSFKPLFVTPLEQPFYTRAGGNKSTTLPNDTFDTIADAEETGGAVQRHRGTLTSRFGLSQNCDNRYDGTIPKPPIRTSVLQFSTKTRLRQMNLKLQKTGRGHKSGPHQTFKVPIDDASVTSNLSSLASQLQNDDDSSSEEEPLARAQEGEEEDEVL
mmetsp:Transcript_1374/g.2238  ORF Transcript_1374/g.2238 Transcript_1374/m.2238 type:complete len:473 (-) Transcript_1374:130-1548(-)